MIVAHRLEKDYVQPSSTLLKPELIVRGSSAALTSEVISW